MPSQASRAPAALRLDLRRLAAAALLLVFALRLAHFAFAAQSPLTYQIGPDEEFYLRFGLDVAFGTGGLLTEFAFMDPLYGYLLGAVLKLTGSVFPVYVIQLLVDCGTALGLILLGRELYRPRAGILAAALYALLGPGMAFTMSLLKTTWVAAFVCWWMLFALRLARGARPWGWMAFGAYCGLGVALRANLLLLVPLALVLLPWLAHRQDGRGLSTAVVQAGALLTGLALPLLLLAARNHHIDDRWAFTPTNGGVVLHQLYNPENPRSLSGAPSFVNYYHPSEVWRGYNAEAERRAGGPLAPKEIEAYWRGEAVDYLLAHPWQSIRNGLRKLADFTAYPEVPNNRSFEDERLFSPLLRWLPQPFGWLFALGVPGLVLLCRQDRRALVLLAPLAMGLVTIAVFFAEDRFRFNIVTPFVLGAAAWLLHLGRLARDREWRVLAAALALPAVLGAWSILQAQRIPPTPTNWQRIATGYLKMDDRAALERLLADIAREQPSAVGLHEFHGLMALHDGDHPRARAELEAALAQRQNRHEVWHNYARALEATGETGSALGAQINAYRIAPLPEYAFRIGELLEASGRSDEAAMVYGGLAGDPSAGAWQARAALRLADLER